VLLAIDSDDLDCLAQAAAQAEEDRFCVGDGSNGKALGEKYWHELILTK
jgi:hypothetical protein